MHLQSEYPLNPGIDTKIEHATLYVITCLSCIDIPQHQSFLYGPTKGIVQRDKRMHLNVFQSDQNHWFNVHFIGIMHYVYLLGNSGSYNQISHLEKTIPEQISHVSIEEINSYEAHISILHRNIKSGYASSCGVENEYIDEFIKTYLVLFVLRTVLETKQRIMRCV